jgi:hypothetical protein
VVSVLSARALRGADRHFVGGVTAIRANISPFILELPAKSLSKFENRSFNDIGAAI